MLDLDRYSSAVTLDNCQELLKLMLKGDCGLTPSERLELLDILDQMEGLNTRLSIGK